MENVDTKIVSAALSAATPDEATKLQEMIAHAIGGEYRRPVGDKWNNHGLMGASGSFDLKLIEPVTNMQDAIIERKAIAKWGSIDQIPYSTPHEAASDLLTGSAPEQAAQAIVTFREATTSTSVTKRARHTKLLTAVFDDTGCGLTPAKIPSTVFGIGGSHKESALFLQGAFGMGGTMTYRNAQAIVLVTRRAPELLLEGEEDSIAVAVVVWQENTKGRTAYYLVTSSWQEPGDQALPWSTPSSNYPDFAPGTHMALIGYRVDGFHRQREGDEKSFDVVANTRLLRPVMPVRFVNETTRGRNTTLRGLENRIENSFRDFPSGTEILPFTYGGTTYLLPMRYTIFEKPREAGGRDKFVAHDHAVMFTSNGQVHHHWSPSSFRSRTRLNKLYDRVLVVVETDELPIRLRTSLFTADRNDLVRGDAAIRLEADVAGFIQGWGALVDENNSLLREALKGSSDQKTLEIARRIGRALSVRGFGPATGSNGTGGSGKEHSGGGGGGGGGNSKPITLHADPTQISGPATVRAVIGQTRAISYTVDAVDSFFDGRGTLIVESDHPEIESNKEITVGRGRGGRVRIMVAIPDTLETGTHELKISLDGWQKISGGIGPRLEHTSILELVDEIPGSGTGSGKKSHSGAGTNGPGEGSNVALKWSSPDKQDDWERITVGEVEQIPAQVLAEAQPEYSELASLGDVKIPTIVLNEEYPPFKKYLAGRNRDLTQVERPKEQYAIGVGVALLLLDKEIETRRSSRKGEEPDEAFVSEAQRAAARAVLAVMPSFDVLAREAGLE